MRQIFVLSALIVLLMLAFISMAKAEEPQNYPPEDLIYVAVLDGFKVPIVIPKGSLNPEHRGKMWQTKDQYEAEWKQAEQWMKEILEEREASE